MAELAIKGHATRGEEVIQLLEMLGGKNIHNYGGTFNECYAIDNNKICTIYTSVAEVDNYTIFTLEQFEEKYPYKVGDEVEYKSNGDANLKSKIIYMEWCNALNQVLYTTEDAHVISTEDITETKSIPPYMDYDIKEDMEKNQTHKTQAEVDKYLQEHSVKNGMNVIDIETCLEMDELKLPENVVINSKGIGSIQFIQWYEKQQYPKNYDECCNVLGIEDRENGYCGYEYELLGEFQKLYICRNAYWKIAGDWKPDWNNQNDCYYAIKTCKNEVCLVSTLYLEDCILAFPTEEMRDAFHENFKELIEECKELL